MLGHIVRFVITDSQASIGADKECDMDRITRALLSEFVEQNKLNLLSENSAFKYFSGFLVTSAGFAQKVYK